MSDTSIGLSPWIEKVVGSRDVQNFNPNHDAQGRFAPAGEHGSGGGGGGGGGLGPPNPEKRSSWMQPDQVFKRGDKFSHAQVLDTKTNAPAVATVTATRGPFTYYNLPSGTTFKNIKTGGTYTPKKAHLYFSPAMQKAHVGARIK